MTSVLLIGRSGKCCPKCCCLLLLLLLCYHSATLALGCCLIAAAAERNDAQKQRDCYNCYLSQNTSARHLVKVLHSDHGLLLLPEKQRQPRLGGCWSCAAAAAVGTKATLMSKEADASYRHSCSRDRQ